MQLISFRHCGYSRDTIYYKQDYSSKKSDTNFGRKVYKIVSTNFTSIKRSFRKPITGGRLSLEAYIEGKLQ